MAKKIVLGFKLIFSSPFPENLKFRIKEIKMLRAHEVKNLNDFT